MHGINLSYAIAIVIKFLLSCLLGTVDEKSNANNLVSQATPGPMLKTSLRQSGGKCTKTIFFYTMHVCALDYCQCNLTQMRIQLQ